jgi:hypothetical protein
MQPSTSQVQYRMWKRKKQWVTGSNRTTSFSPAAVATRIIGWIPRMIASLLVWAVLLVAAIGGGVFAGLSSVAQSVAQQAHGYSFNEAPGAAAQTSANMPQARLSVYYNTVFIQFLYQTLNKLLMCTHFDMPEKRGQTWRNYMGAPLPADLVQQTEGTIGAPEQITTNFNDIVLGQYANYTTASDFAILTSVTSDMEMYRMILAYQLGLTIDDIINNMMDYLLTSDARTGNITSVGPNYFFTKNIIEQMPGSLSTAFVPPMKTGSYAGSILPAFCSDMAIDNSNNSVVDIWKHTEAGQLKLEGLTDKDEGMEPAQVFSLFGCHWRPSTNQPSIANYQGTGLTANYAYLAGRDAQIFINFPNKRHVTPEAKWQNMNLWQGDFARSAYDANNVIMAGTGYNCILGIGPPPDSNSRMRIAAAIPQTT